MTRPSPTRVWSAQGTRENCTAWESVGHLSRWQNILPALRVSRLKVSERQPFPVVSLCEHATPHIPIRNIDDIQIFAPARTLTPLF